MTESNKNPTTEISAADKAKPTAEDVAAQMARKWNMPLPGLAAISLYLLILSGVLILGTAGGHYPPMFLLLAAAFIAASAGLFLLFRWAWALAMAAVLLLACYYTWIFSTMHMASAIVQGMLNLVFFLYLIRTEVRSKLR
ncbi:MAG: hypothetical protein KGN79_11535 [Acidobacteriota bacterium]|nr:hypothetical protein [Acidobacteriota bacterium]